VLICELAHVWAARAILTELMALKFSMRRLRGSFFSLARVKSLTRSDNHSGLIPITFFALASYNGLKSTSRRCMSVAVSDVFDAVAVRPCPSSPLNASCIPLKERGLPVMSSRLRLTNSSETRSSASPASPPSVCDRPGLSLIPLDPNCDSMLNIVKRRPLLCSCFVARD